MKTTHLVIARYKEALDWVRPTHYNLMSRTSLETYVYNKGPELFNSALFGPGDRSPFPEVTKLENEGRDGGTLLYHLWFVNRHAVIPDEMIFLQGNPFDHLPPGGKDITMPQFLPYYLSGHLDGEYAYLNGVLECDYRGKPHHMWDLNLIEAWSRIAHIAYGHGMDFSDVPNIFRFSPGMSQIIPRICMKAPAGFWLDIDDWLLEHQNHGYELERLWPYIFSNIRKHNGQKTSERNAPSEHHGHR